MERTSKKQKTFLSYYTGHQSTESLLKDILGIKDHSKWILRSINRIIWKYPLRIEGLLTGLQCVEYVFKSLLGITYSSISTDKILHPRSFKNERIFQKNVSRKILFRGLLRVYKNFQGLNTPIKFLQFKGKLRIEKFLKKQNQNENLFKLILMTKDLINGMTRKEYMHG